MREIPEFILTRSGKQLNLSNPNIDDIEMEDIAFGLSNITRFTGQIPFYSVAEHSINVAKLVEPYYPEYTATALLHDAQEAFIGDVSTILKCLLPDYEEIENRFCELITKKFNLAGAPSIVKSADLQLCVDEANHCWGAELTKKLGIDLIPREITLQHYAPEKAYSEFTIYARRLGLL